MRVMGSDGMTEIYAFLIICGAGVIGFLVSKIILRRNTVRVVAMLSKNSKADEKLIQLMCKE